MVMCYYCRLKGLALYRYSIYEWRRLSKSLRLQADGRLVLGSGRGWALSRPLMTTAAACRRQCHITETNIRKCMAFL